MILLHLQKYFSYEYWTVGQGAERADAPLLSRSRLEIPSKQSHRHRQTRGGEAPKENNVIIYDMTGSPIEFMSVLVSKYFYVTSLHKGMD